MKRMLILFLSLFILPITLVLGDGDCPAIVQQAIASTADQCNATGRNQACYGYLTLKAQPQPGINQFTFTQPGDKVAVASIESLRLSPMQLDQGTWGIALLRLQASLPSADTQNITVLTFGDVQMNNAVLPETHLDVLTTHTANIRVLPNETAAVLGSLPAAQTVVAVERLADASWLRIQIPDSDQMGWVSATLLQPQGDLSSLNIAQTSQPAYRPMQSFYFQSGSDQPACAQLPASGLMIQTPEGSGEVRLWINEVRIDFGSTVLFEAQPGGTMSVTTVEGHARVEAMGVTQMALAGSRVEVPLSADLKPSAPPMPPETYDAASLQNLPLTLLERPITIHPGLTQAEISQQIVSAQAGNPTTTIPVSNQGNGCSGTNCNGTNGSTNQGDGGGSNCPGNSCHDHCPGNSCHDQCPGNSCHDHGNGVVGNIIGDVNVTVDTVTDTLCNLNLPLLRRITCSTQNSP